MHLPIRIGTRESALALWQATQVKDLLEREGFATTLVPIKSEGDIDLKTPLYEMGVQGVFTRSLDIALLNNKIDIAVHSMKDVPTQLPEGIEQAAVLKRGPVHDLLVYKQDTEFLLHRDGVATIATSSIRRKAQWLHKYPNHRIENLRGNVNTRLRKLGEENWDAAIFAQAGLERIHLRPEKSLVLDWMLPAPAQGAILVVSRGEDEILSACEPLNDANTALCTRIERDFLRTLLGGCSTPISALAEIEDGDIYFSGQILSHDGKQKAEIEKILPLDRANDTGKAAAEELLERGGRTIVESIRAAEQAAPVKE
ncbi:hydroxymethylbilane synthase [Puia dinghuensis]|uniref:Hydroxymethylbilane synthase n=1 Tax=Puia dinghuensis TaxID=1792502 RepID=A0A8J2UG81_9BACT|nr:hydroxymethylbilane synthase [Puia dinghuensis]GGB13632.1 hydroxymethylbilane synthase [Puia dinghuensis]